MRKVFILALGFAGLGIFISSQSAFARDGLTQAQCERWGGDFTREYTGATTCMMPGGFAENCARGECKWVDTNKSSGPRSPQEGPQGGTRHGPFPDDIADNVGGSDSKKPGAGVVKETKEQPLPKKPVASNGTIVRDHRKTAPKSPVAGGPPPAAAPRTTSTTPVTNPAAQGGVRDHRGGGNVANRGGPGGTTVTSSTKASGNGGGRLPSGSKGAQQK